MSCQRRVGTQSLTHPPALAGSDVPADGYSRPYVAAAAYGSAVYGFLALMISLAAARLVVPGFADTRRARQLTPVIVAWLATPLVFYMYVAPPFAHACSAFIVAASWFPTTWSATWCGSG